MILFNAEQLKFCCTIHGMALQGNEAILRSASTMRHGVGREKKIPAMYQ